MSSALHMVATYVHMHIHTYITRSHCIAQVYSTWVEALQQKHYTHSLLTWKGTNCLGHRPRRCFQSLRHSNRWMRRALCPKPHVIPFIYTPWIAQTFTPAFQVPHTPHVQCYCTNWLRPQLLPVANEDTIYSVHEPTAQPSARTILTKHTSSRWRWQWSTKDSSTISLTRHCEEMTKCKLWPPGSPHVCTNRLGRTS